MKYSSLKRQKKVEEQIETQKSYIASLMLQILLQEGKEGLKNNQSLKDALQQLNLLMRQASSYAQETYQWRRYTYGISWVLLFFIGLGFIIYYILKFNI